MADKKKGTLIYEDLFTNVVCDSGPKGLSVAFLYEGHITYANSILKPSSVT